MSRETWVYAIGNAYRRDDAAGWLVAEDLRRRRIHRLNILTSGPEALLQSPPWDVGDRVLLVDAASSGATPGTIFRFDLRAGGLDTDEFTFSTHTMGLTSVLQLYATLYPLPAEWKLMAIEGRHFEQGTECSPEVLASVSVVADEIEAWCMSGFE